MEPRQLGQQFVRKARAVLKELEGDFAACIRDGVIDFTKPAAIDGALDRVAFQRLRFGGEGELHDVEPWILSGADGQMAGDSGDWR